MVGMVPFARTASALAMNRGTPMEKRGNAGQSSDARGCRQWHITFDSEAQLVANKQSASTALTTAVYSQYLPYPRAPLCLLLGGCLEMVVSRQSRVFVGSRLHLVSVPAFVRRQRQRQQPCNEVQGCTTHPLPSHTLFRRHVASGA